MKEILQIVIDAYIECAYFCDTGEPDQCPKDAVLSDLGYLTAVADCADFMRLCEREEVLTLFRQTNKTWDSFGHDLWFTRNGHGCGFWDRGLGDLGDKLTDLCKTMCERSLVEGEPGIAYIE